jgi:hypothetical protein
LTTQEEIGNSAILSYQLVWDSATGSASIVASKNMQLTKLLIGLTGGQDYLFKVRAQNIYGYGAYSDLVTIRASSVPDTMNIVDSISVLETIVVSWTAPYNGGEDIDLYDVQILTPGKVFVSDATCTGAIEDGLSCLFSHEYLMATYGFQVGDIL